MIDLTGGLFDRAGQDRELMAAHPLGPESAMPSEWNASSHIYRRSQLMACMRAALIALVLLGILALIVLS